MSNINKKLFKRLHLNHAYGQLIALIFVPIAVLACVGAMLVMTETSNAAKAQQRQMALAILDVAGAPAQTARLVKSGNTVVVIGGAIAAQIIA